MNKKASLTVIFLTVFIDLLGFGILIPLLPAFASKELGVSDLGIGVVIASFSFMQFLFNPILGKLSDKFGRRPIITMSLSLTAISYIIFAFADSFALLLFSRMLAGFGGSNIGVAQAYIADITPQSERSKGMGMIGAAFGLGFVFGPFIGGLLSHYGYDVAGFAAAGFSFSALIFSLFFLPESLEKKAKIEKLRIKFFDWKYALNTLKMPVVGIMIVIFFIIVFSMANIYGTFALLGFKVYGLTDMDNGILFGILGLIGAIVQGGLIRIISKKFRDKSILITGTILMMIGLGMLPYGGNFLGLALVATVLAIGTGVLQPTILSMVSKYAPQSDQGAILGLNQSLASLARVLGPLWGGISFQYLGYSFPFLTGAFFTFITVIIIIVSLKKADLQV